MLGGGEGALEGPVPEGSPPNGPAELSLPCEPRRRLYTSCRVDTLQ